MADTVNITVASSPVTVDVTEAAVAPVQVACTESANPVSVAVSEAANPVTVDVTPPPASPVTVEVAEAPAGAPGPAGAAGANAEIVVLQNIPGGATALAQYLALSPAEQMSGKWFVLAKPT